MSLTSANPEDQPDTQAGGLRIETQTAGPASPVDVEKLGVPPARSRRPRLTRALIRSLMAVILGSLVLRLASHTTGLMLQFYFDDINKSYYALSYTLTGFITASFFITELSGSLVLGAMSDRYGRRLFILLGP